MRYAPLEWWRNEHVVLGKRENGIAFCPVVKAIVRVPKDPIKPLGINGKKRGPRKPTPRAQTTNNPEEGWDDNTLLTGVVVDWQSKEEVQRRMFIRLIVCIIMSNLRDRHCVPFSAGGVSRRGERLFLLSEDLRRRRVHCRWSTSHSTRWFQADEGYERQYLRTHICRDSSLFRVFVAYLLQVFYVIEGAVTFKVHNSSYILCTGGSILVPRGNHYFVENISDRDAKLFFAQARRVAAEDEEPADHKPALAMPSQTPDRRSSTATPAANVPTSKVGPPKRRAAKKG
jgi:centromere protein C